MDSRASENSCLVTSRQVTMSMELPDPCGKDPLAGIESCLLCSELKGPFYGFFLAIGNAPVNNAVCVPKYVPLQGQL